MRAVRAQNRLRRQVRLDQASSLDVGRNSRRERNVVPSAVRLIVELASRNVQVFDAAAAFREIDGEQGGSSAAHVASRVSLRTVFRRVQVHAAVIALGIARRGEALSLLDVFEQHVAWTSATRQFDVRTE